MVQKNRPSAGILTCEDGATIAYDRLSGKKPGVVFFHGFCADKSGGKALAVEAFCQKRGQAFLRFDVTGHGQSSGRFEDGTIGRWAEDAIIALDRLTEGPQILIGSSMGGWLALLAALARPSRVAGFLGLAAAPDFTEDLVYDTLTPEQKRDLWEQGSIVVPNDDDDFPPLTLTRTLIEEGRNHLLLKQTIPLACPVRLIHGQKDDSVPWKRALLLTERLASDDVVLTLVKNGGHRLNEAEDLERMTQTLDSLLSLCEAKL